MKPTPRAGKALRPRIYGTDNADRDGCLVLWPLNREKWERKFLAIDVTDSASVAALAERVSKAIYDSFREHSTWGKLNPSWPKATEHHRRMATFHARAALAAIAKELKP